MNNYRYAFTMIELVFVIVVLGILAAIAIPKFAATRDDAQISKGRADVASIRSAIMTDRQARLIKGHSEFIEAGVGTYTVDGTVYNQLDKNGLFGGILTYPITDSTKNGHWHNLTHPDVNSSTYSFKVHDTSVTFKYTRSDGKFTCDKTTGTAAQKKLCKNLID